MSLYSYMSTGTMNNLYKREQGAVSQESDVRTADPLETPVSSEAAAKAKQTEDADSFDTKLERLRDIVKNSEWAQQICQDDVVWRLLLEQALKSRNENERDALLVVRNYARFRAAYAWPMRLSRAHVRTDALHSGVHWWLPEPDKHGRSVVVLNVRFIKIQGGCSLEAYQKMGAYITEKVAAMSNTQSNGICLIVDLSGLTWDLMWELASPTDIQRGVSMWRDTFPCKLRRVFVVRASFISELLIENVLSFVAPKIQQRCMVLTGEDHYSLGPLHKEVPRETLPPSLGGTLVNYDWRALADDIFSDH